MAISYIRTHGGSTPAGSSTTITLTPVATVPVGDFLILAAGRTTTSTTATVSDTQSNTYQVDRTTNSTARCLFMASSKITTQLTTSDTITVTFSGSVASRLLAVDQFAGLHTGTWAGTGNSAVGTSASPSSGTATPSASGALLYGACVYGNAGAAYAPGSTNAGAYVYTESNEFKQASNNGIETEYYIGAASGIGITAGGTMTNASFTQGLQIYLPTVAEAGTFRMFEMF